MASTFSMRPLVGHQQAFLLSRLQSFFHDGRDLTYKKFASQNPVVRGVKLQIYLRVPQGYHSWDAF